MVDKIAFDPGYGPHITSFINNIEYMYSEINKFKNLGQKKFKFKSFYPQILLLIEQNIAFYLGCLLWATYVVTQKGAELTGNYCLGNEYNEDAELQELNYVLEFIKRFDKDTKYYLNIGYKIEEEKLEIIELYKEFAKINEGFVKSKTADDIKLPSGLKNPSPDDIQKIFDTITKEVVTTGDFNRLYSLKEFII